MGCLPHLRAKGARRYGAPSSARTQIRSHTETLTASFRSVHYGNRHGEANAEDLFPLTAFSVRQEGLGLRAAWRRRKRQRWVARRARTACSLSALGSRSVSTGQRAWA